MIRTKGGFVAWLTGLPASGKTTLAMALKKHLANSGWPVQVLDGDAVRADFSSDLGYSPLDRTENVRRVAEKARELADGGSACIVSLISPLRAHREIARKIIGAHRFAEVYVSAGLDVCERRDPKGLYRKARAGEISDFTGISSPYEPPEQPDLVVDTGALGVAESIALLQVHFASSGKVE